MGLISRVSSRTYRKSKKVPQKHHGPKGKASGYGPGQAQPRQKEGSSQPALREAQQELWRRPGHPAKTRPHPLRSMAQVHQAPASARRAPAATQGAPEHQPVQSDLGQTNRYSTFQARSEVRSRVQDRKEGTLGGAR